MSWRNRVIWSQGMFLQPHHYQQECRFVESLVDARARAAHPYGWGYADLVLDEAQLALGRVGLIRAVGILPDGTPFSIPDHDALPPPLEVTDDLKGELVYLAAPLARAGVTEVDFGDGQGDDMCRFRVLDAELRDHTNATDDPEPIQTGALALRLLRERDASDGYALLGIARVLERRSDGQLVLDRAYLAPQSRIEASGQLSAVAGLLHGLIQQRGRQLAARMGQLGHGLSEVGDFLMLQTLNRAEPVFRQFAGAPSVHPWTFYIGCLQLAGDLATFSGNRRHPPDYPLYRHDDLQRVFAPVVEDLRNLLSTELQRHAVQIELIDRNHGVRTAVIADHDLLRTASFVLAVQAQVPAEQLRQRFPAQSKLGPVERIRDLVNLQLPGVVLNSLPVAPRQLPFHAGFHYFELERQGDLWKQLERTGNLALHVAGDFPGLELELWAIRQS
ncbi:MAG: type VI secretion system baseplate subunit TssK [Burkholderiaceae bacterium]|nr:type VI secretion system baseplate subunit TssK [Aquabacterium sp.]NUP85475.1 type VI secretion system baseplate subunit TssK [Burkholderiaceae bacterium]